MLPAHTVSMQLAMIDIPMLLMTGKNNQVVKTTAVPANQMTIALWRMALAA